MTAASIGGARLFAARRLTRSFSHHFCGVERAALKCTEENGEEKGRSDESEEDEIDVVVLLRPDFLAASCEFRPSAPKPPWTLHFLPPPS
jgi:hypothetical protein